VWSSRPSRLDPLSNQNTLHSLLLLLDIWIISYCLYLLISLSITRYCKNSLKSERVRDCYFTSIQHFLLAISLREQVNFKWDDEEVCFVLDQHTELDFYSAISLKQQSVGRHVAPLGHIFLIPSQPVFVSFFLMLRT
jgi:hypothetical protein